MAQNQAAKLKALRQSFVTADKDGDSLLNKSEFKEFVEIGYQKQCPEGMYEHLCKHFSRDPDIGIDWATARAVWLQAQGGSSRSKSPSPPHLSKQQNGTVPNPSSNIKQAFIQCDKDADGFLNKSEFPKFVSVGFKKASVPNGMYEQVCKHFKKDPTIGIDWLSAFALWKQSNPNASNNTQSPPKRTKTPPPKRLNTRPPALNRVKTTANVTSKSTLKSKIPALGSLTVTKSTGQIYKKDDNGSALTEKNLRALESPHYTPHSKSMGDDEHSVESESYTSQNNRRPHRRVGSVQRGNGSFDDGPDASQMVVQMMETKVKNLQNQLKLERAKRKKTEELAQSLLTSNEEYKKQIGDLSTTNTKFKTEGKTLKDQLRKMKQIVDDDRNTIKHLKEQRNSKKNERDEAYALIGKIEEKYELQLKKERQKHKNEMEKLSAGFLQSLGAEPGKDVSTVIKELKQRNAKLQREVDTLAETLARKQMSLIEALSAVDNIAMEDEKQHAMYYSMEMEHALSNGSPNGSKAKMKEKFQKFKERRMTIGHKKEHSDNDDSSGISGLPKPPKRRNSQIGIIFGKSKPHHRPTATFFKRAVGDEPHKDTLDITTAKNGKELQFVAQQLTNDVGNKTQSIENLEMANTALMQQMQKMQKQMEDLKVTKHDKQESTHSINDLP